MERQDFIVEAARVAIDRNRPLCIRGGNSKAFYGYPARGEVLDVSGHSGMVQYDPGELIVTCKAGSRLSDINSALLENGQHLPFEPPAFGEHATIGGTIACGFSGPRRPWSGSLRDYLLGVKLVNGRGEIVRFGGQVMKNVAGYDVSRLMAGSMGTLGIILEASFKVLPIPAAELTLEFECCEADAIRRINGWCGQPLPLSGAFWHQGRLLVRLSGAESETRRAARKLGADRLEEGPETWHQLKEHRLDFFRRPGDLWRLALPPSAEPLGLDEDCLVDWGGAVRWYHTDRPASEMREMASRAGGQAALFRGTSESGRFHPLPPALRQLHARIKQAMDPHGIFNPFRMSRDW